MKINKALAIQQYSNTKLKYKVEKSFLLPLFFVLFSFFNSPLFSQIIATLPPVGCTNCSTGGLATLNTVAGSNTPTVPACDATVNGMYTPSAALVGSNHFIDISLNVSTVGNYSITTNTVNGYSFSDTGTFAGTGNQTVSLAGSGVPTADATDVFVFSYGGSSCSFSVTVGSGASSSSSEYGNPCINPDDTELVEVTTATGRVWMDRNLGAENAAISIDSSNNGSTGCPFQWGRYSDGHESLQADLFLVDQIGGGVIVNSAAPNLGNPWDGRVTGRSGSADWLQVSDNTLWQGVNGTNNPCPTDYRVATAAEWTAEQATWATGSFTDTYPAQGGVLRVSSHTAFSAPNSNGGRYGSAYIHAPLGSRYNVEMWTSTLGAATGQSVHLIFTDNPASYFTLIDVGRIYGFTVRCIRCSQSAGGAAGDNAGNCPYP